MRRSSRHLVFFVVVWIWALSDGFTIPNKALYHRGATSRQRLPTQSTAIYANHHHVKEEDRSSHSRSVELDQINRRLRTTFASVLICFAMLFSPLGQEAHAGFGPTGSATTSPTAGLVSVNVEDLSVKKLQQLIGSTIDERRLDEFQRQLDALIDGISSSFAEEEGVVEEVGEGVHDEGYVRPAPTPRVPDEASTERIELARKFQDQIISRERLLDKLEAQPLWFNFFAAFCGSLASTLVMHPVDTIKTRLQVQSSNSTDEGNGKFANLYEGLTGNIWKEGPPSALYLGVYEAVKSNLLHGRLSNVWGGLVGISTHDPTYLLSIYLIAGASGELVGSTIRAPAEAVKSLVQTKAASSTSEAFRIAFMNREGRENTFRAWSASIWRDVPFGASQLAIFELIKAFILNNPNIDFDSSTLQAEAIIGAVAGGCGSFLTNPTDVITTRIITQCAEDTCLMEPLGFLDMGKLIYQEGGLAAFFAGWQARVLYWAPAISIFLTCYCSVRQMGIKLDLFGL